MASDLQRRRRRFAAAYVLSLFVHALALLVLVVLTIDSGVESIVSVAPEEITAIREEQQPEPARTASPPIQSRPPDAVARPSQSGGQVAGRIAAAAVVPPKAPGGTRAPAPARRPELARNVAKAEAQPLARKHDESRSSPREPSVPIPVAAKIQVSSLPVLAPFPLVATLTATAAPVASTPPSPVAAATVAPTIAPTQRPTFAPTAPPTVAPTAPPTVAPTAPPTVAPTAPPTLAPTSPPTVAPTIPPTHAPATAPTIAPTAAPTIAPTLAPTTPPTVAPTRAPRTVPTLEPVAKSTSVPTAAASRAPSPAPTDVLAVPPARARPPAAKTESTPVPALVTVPSHSPAPAAHEGRELSPTAEPGPSASTRGGNERPNSAGGPSPAGGSSADRSGSSAQRTSPSAAPPGVTPNRALANLNDRLKSLTTGGDVDYRPTRLKIGDAQSVIDRAMSAYEAALAPPADILRRTFGLIYERRVSGHPDSVAYVFDTYTIGPITMCKAWKIVEHPPTPVAEVGPVAGSAGIGGGVVSNANSAVIRHDNGGRAEASVVQFPCTPRSYTAVTPGSITTPVPRHPDLGPSPAPSPSLAP